VVKIVTQLAGGLGNQLFQYAAARAYADRSGADLVLDTWSGFVRDVQYRRTYALAPFPVSGRRATPIERLPFWTQRFLTALYRRTSVKSGKTDPRPDRRRLRKEPSERCFDSRILHAPAREDTWLMGYWQSPAYFAPAVDRLVKELSPPPSRSANALAIGNAAKTTESVAIGVRLYEESRVPGAHSSDGKMKSIDDINRAIDTIAEKIGDGIYYIFCSHHADELKSIRTPSSPIFITGDEGFEDPIETLWLLSQCRHHIFTNSTFYWWGAWLAENGNPDDRHHIMAADNFINVDAIPGHWETF
jgi:hypothetical protein